MSACFVTEDFPGDFDENQLRIAFDCTQQNDRYENGHSYSGGLGMADGLRIDTKLTFTTSDDANEKLMDICEKWQEAVAVRIKPEELPEFWHIAAWCAS